MRNGVDELLPPHLQRRPVPPTHRRCACRRNWSTTPSTSSTTTQGPSHKRLAPRAWLGRTRSHFCKFLKITRPKLPSSDPSRLPPLRRYVQILHFTCPSDATDPSTALDCFERSEPHTLALRSCDLRDLGEQTVRRCFARFPCTSITTLELREISLTHGTLLVLLSLFPNVDNFTISPNHRWEYGPGNDDDDKILQHVSPSPIRGSF